MADNKATIDVTLPSRGLVNLTDEGESRIPDGIVHISKMGSEELGLLASQSSDLTTKLSSLIKRCSSLPNAVDPLELTVNDRFYLLLMIRSFTLGPEYTVSYKCQHCGAQQTHVVNISDELDVIHADEEDFSHPLKIELRDADTLATFRFPTGNDEQLITKRAKRSQMKKVKEADTTLIYRLALLLEQLDGESAGNLMERENFIRKLTAADVLRIDNALGDAEPGVDTTVYPECGACGGMNEMPMPFQPEFFRPTNL